MATKRQIIYLNEDAEFYDDMEFNEEYNDINEDTLNEEEGSENNEPKPPMTDEKLRIESVKLATSIAKLMNNVTPEDIIKLSGIVADYIRSNGNTGDLEAAPAEDEDEFGDFGEAE